MIVSSSVPVVPFAIVILPICADAQGAAPVPMLIEPDGTIELWKVTVP